MYNPKGPDNARGGRSYAPFRKGTYTRCAIYVVQSPWCKVCGASDVAQSMWCSLRGAIYVVHSLRGASYVAQHVA
eukprot:5088837-Pyramimonas_sp.AAC.1